MLNILLSKMPRVQKMFYSNKPKKSNKCFTGSAELAAFAWRCRKDKGMHGCSLYQADLSFVSRTCVSLYLLSNITACTVMTSDVEFMTEVSGGDGDKYETGLNMIVFVG